jgi:hypothetical protein
VVLGPSDAAPGVSDFAEPPLGAPKDCEPAAVRFPASGAAAVSGGGAGRGGAVPPHPDTTDTSATKLHIGVAKMRANMVQAGRIAT